MIFIFSMMLISMILFATHNINNGEVIVLGFAFLLYVFTDVVQGEYQRKRRRKEHKKKMSETYY